MKTQPQNNNELKRQQLCTELERCGGYAGLIIKSLNGLKANISRGLSPDCAELDKNARFIMECRDKLIPEMVVKAGVLFGAIYHYYKKMGCNSKA